MPDQGKDGARGQLRLYRDLLDDTKTAQSKKDYLLERYDIVAEAYGLPTLEQWKSGMRG